MSHYFFSLVPSRSRLLFSLKTFYRSLDFWLMPMFNDIGAPRKTANKKYLLNYIKVPSVYPLAFINSITSQGKATGVGTSSNFDVYAAMSFSTSTWVLHESGSFWFT